MCKDGKAFIAKAKGRNTNGDLERFATLVGRSKYVFIGDLYNR